MPREIIQHDLDPMWKRFCPAHIEQMKILESGFGMRITHNDLAGRQLTGDGKTTDTRDTGTGSNQGRNGGPIINPQSR